MSISPNKVVNGTPTTLRSVGAHYHWRYVADMSPDEEVHKKRIEIALDICQLNSGCRPFDIAKDQLDFLWAFLQGHESNMELLAKINLGLLAAREFEVRDMRLAELIYEIESTKDYLLQRGPRNAT